MVVRRVIGISDMQVSSVPEDVLITYSLGSCIGISLWDPKVRVAGLLHYMLPTSKLDPARAEKNPYMFGDVGIPKLFRAVYELGAQKNRLIINVVGGSQLMDSGGIFNIGKKNYKILEMLFAKNNIKPTFVEVGGAVNRTISVEVGTGKTILKTSGKAEVVL